MKGFIIAGASSGSGKTTLTTGLLSTFTKRGLRVQSYKVGPDYIDPMFHEFVTKKPSYNLPLWLVEEEGIRRIFDQHCDQADMIIIEGVMGMFDGTTSLSTEGSTAHCAKILNMPVIIIFDASSMSLSSAAIVKGFKEFDPDVSIKGVILNNVSSDAHYELLREGIEHFTGIKCYGYLKNDPDVSFGSRHLGLMQASEIMDLQNRIDRLVDNCNQHIDIEGLLNDFSFEATPKCWGPDDKKINLNLGVLMDDAFKFYYKDNLELLEHMGVRIVPLSPLHDQSIPKHIDAFYFGGGYPEVFAKQLEENLHFRENLRDEIKRGKPVYAECGGLMYLCDAIVDLNGEESKMLGVLQARAVMTKSLQNFGYVQVNGSDLQYKAHEFHHSVIMEKEGSAPLEKCFQVIHNRSGKSWTCGYTNDNRTVLGTYAHFHFYSSFDAFQRLLDFWMGKPLPL